MKKRAVRQFDNENNYIFDYTTISEAAKITGISKSSISKCCSGLQKNAGGYIWRYAAAAYK